MPTKTNKVIFKINAFQSFIVVSPKFNVTFYKEKQLINNKYYF